MDVVVAADVPGPFLAGTGVERADGWAGCMHGVGARWEGEGRAEASSYAFVADKSSRGLDGYLGLCLYAWSGVSVRFPAPNPAGTGMPSRAWHRAWVWMGRQPG